MKNKVSLKIPQSLVLVGAFMVSNFLNFLFNAALGRSLSLELFGELTLFSTLWAIIGIFLNAFGGTVNHKVAYLFSINKKRAENFYRSAIKKAVVTGLVFTVIWVALASQIASFFQITDVSLVLFFTPSIVLGILLSTGRGYLQGALRFNVVALLVLLEPIAKLVSAVVLTAFGLSSWVYLSIPISVCVSLVVLSLYLYRSEPAIIEAQKAEAFPIAFFGASILTALSTYAFLTFDTLLVKHFLSASSAGEYALLSLVGKMVFFFGSLLNVFIITYVSRLDGATKDSRNPFNVLFVFCIFLTIMSFVILGPLGYIFVPFLLGDKASIIFPYLTTYALATALYTISNTLVIYNLARKRYFFSVLSLFISLVLIVAIVLKHDSVAEITAVLFVISFLSFCVVSISHFVFEHGKYFMKNFIDFIDLFDPIKFASRGVPGKKRILIFNWRDTKHINAGGAEVYVHEIAKRWVEDGHHVTLFCGNDGISKRYELVEGMEVVRRGGFYTVYFWAFWYYLFQFRGTYDVVIDCQNGVPFFTPMYVKEPVYAVIHHVHQEVFNQFLDKIPALIASSIERYLMPWAYKHAHFITVSPSTKNEMKKIGIKGKGIEIIYCGVDLSKLKPGRKSTIPTILYLGRLKAYKSVDVLLKAFAKIVSKNSRVTLVIAGIGDEETNLKNLSVELNIDKNVKFLGKVSEEEKVKLLQKAWVFVNPSMMEGWGITSIEANACGTPVVASDVPGLRDSVNNPHTGYLVKYGDVDQFSRKINSLLTNETSLKKMTKESIKWAKKFTWGNSSDDFAKLL